jgi:hypothetical protein
MASFKKNGGKSLTTFYWSAIWELAGGRPDEKDKNGERGQKGSK